MGPAYLRGPAGPGCAIVHLRRRHRASQCAEILDELRELPPEERLRVVERIVHEVAAEVTAQHGAAGAAIWADESEAEFEAFRSSLERLRAADT